MPSARNLVWRKDFSASFRTASEIHFPKNGNKVINDEAYRLHRSFRSRSCAFFQNRLIMISADPLWYKDAVIYELHVRSYFDSVDDGIGDFRGLTRKLDYLE